MKANPSEGVLADNKESMLRSKEQNKNEQPKTPNAKYSSVKNYPKNNENKGFNNISEETFTSASILRKPTPPAEVMEAYTKFILNDEKPYEDRYLLKKCLSAHSSVTTYPENAGKSKTQGNPNSNAVPKQTKTVDSAIKNYPKDNGKKGFNRLSEETSTSSSILGKPAPPPKVMADYTKSLCDSAVTACPENARKIKARKYRNIKAQKKKQRKYKERKAIDSAAKSNSENVGASKTSESYFEVGTWIPASETCETGAREFPSTSQHLQLPSEELPISAQSLQLPSSYFSAMKISSAV